MVRFEKVLTNVPGFGDGIMARANDGTRREFQVRPHHIRATQEIRAGDGETQFVSPRLAGLAEICASPEPLEVPVPSLGAKMTPALSHPVPQMFPVFTAHAVPIAQAEVPIETTFSSQISLDLPGLKPPLLWPGS